MLNGLSENARGALFICLSMAGFVLNDTFIKLVSTDLSLFQTIFIRGIFVSTYIYFIARWFGALNLPRPAREILREPALLWRTFAEVGATVCFLQALFNLPIANVTAVLQLLPLTITLAAALFLGEAVGWRRYTAIVVGFIGVLLIVRPGTEGFTIFSLYALGAVAFVTLRDLMTRSMAKDVPSLFVSLMTALAIFALGAVGSFFQPWGDVEMWHVAMLAIGASWLALGYICGVLAMRHGEVAFVSPFRYSILIWALLLGFFVFGDLPDAWELAGAAIIVGAGLFTFFRERRQRMRQPAPH